jgi:hypothetical protein
VLKGIIMSIETYPEIFEQPNAQTQVWYWKPQHALEALGSFNNNFVEAVRSGQLQDTHVHLGNVTMTHPEAVYAAMQGENWSPEGEARPIIMDKGLDHTSMSMGDVVVTPDGKRHMVSMIGFTTLD